MVDGPIRLEHDEIEAIRKEAVPDVKEIDKYRLYARGTHNRVLSIEQRRILGGKAANHSADNVIRLILSTLASRLQFEGWAVEAEPVQTFLDRLFVTSRVARLQFNVHWAAFRDAMAGVSLRWHVGADGAGRVALAREEAWNGETGLFVGYDAYGEPAWAVRDFKQRQGKRVLDRRVVYYADRIERFVREGGWRHYELPGEEGSNGVVPWVRPDGTPLGLPVVPFVNGLGDDPLYGTSELVGLLGLQDDLNAIQHDITGAAMFTAWQMYWMSGVNPADAPKVGPGRVLSSDNPNARFGVLPPGPMDSLTAAHSYKRQTMAVDASVPLHLILGAEWPSGEALLRSEMPLVDKVKRVGTVFGPEWTTVAHRATEIEDVFGAGGLDEDALISARFSPPERLDEMTLIQVQQARANLYDTLSRIADPVLLEKIGLLTKDEIAAMLADRKKRQAAFAAANPPVAEF